MMLGRFLSMLKDSLLQKSKVLDDITDAGKKQKAVIEEASDINKHFDMEAFDLLVDEKDALISKLDKLDEGFQELYDGIKESLEAEKDNYKKEIAELKILIKEVTDKSIAIQAEELRNKQALERVFSEEHKKYRAKKDTSRIAYGYYESMNKLNVNSPQFLDSKK